MNEKAIWSLFNLIIIIKSMCYAHSSTPLVSVYSHVTYDM